VALFYCHLKSGTAAEVCSRTWHGCIQRHQDVQKGLTIWHMYVDITRICTASSVSMESLKTLKQRVFDFTALVQDHYGVCLLFFDFVSMRTCVFLLTLMRQDVQRKQQHFDTHFQSAGVPNSTPACYFLHAFSLRKSLRPKS